MKHKHKPKAEAKLVGKAIHYPRRLSRLSTEKEMSCRFDFSGKTVLVTGAGRGIGKVIVDELIKSGASVIAVSKTQSNLDTIAAQYPSVRCIQADLSDWSSTEAKLKPLANEVDCLVNNAGYAECFPFGGLTERSMDVHYDLNVKAAVNVSQCVCAGMKDRRWGAIVNVSSLAGLVSLDDHLAYGTSKAALDMVTKAMALELGKFNIRVNSVNPTVTATEMSLVGWSEESKKKKMLSKIPMGRFVEPIEVANAVLFLCSDAASMINGTLLPIDGGASNTSP